MSQQLLPNSQRLTILIWALSEIIIPLFKYQKIMDRECEIEAEEIGAHNIICPKIRLTLYKNYRNQMLTSVIKIPTLNH